MSVLQPTTPLKTTRSFLRQDTFFPFSVVPLTWMMSFGTLPMRSNRRRWRFERVISSSIGGDCIYRLLPRYVTLGFNKCRFGCFPSSSMNCYISRKLKLSKVNRNDNSTWFFGKMQVSSMLVQSRQHMQLETCKYIFLFVCLYLRISMNIGYLQALHI